LIHQIFFKTFIYFCISTATLFSVEIITETIPEIKEQKISAIYVVEPKYPRTAQAFGLEGYVILEYTVNKKGKTENIIVIEAKCGDIVGESMPIKFRNDPEDCEDFNSSAIYAAKQLRYKPIIKNGKKITRDQVRWRYRFEMDEGDFKAALNIPDFQISTIERLLKKAKTPSDRTIKSAEALALETVEEFSDVNFYLGKIYSFMEKDDLAIKHFRDFLDFKKEYKNQSAFTSQHRTIYETSALVLITEKLYKKNNYKEIIELAALIETQKIFIKENKDAKNDSKALIEFSNFYLGTSYLFEGYIDEGKDNLLWVKETTDNDVLLNMINQYLAQINDAT